MKTPYPALVKAINGKESTVAELRFLAERVRREVGDSYPIVKAQEVANITTRRIMD